MRIIIITYANPCGIWYTIQKVLNILPNGWFPFPWEEMVAKLGKKKVDEDPGWPGIEKWLAPKLKPQVRKQLLKEKRDRIAGEKAQKEDEKREKMEKAEQAKKEKQLRVKKTTKGTKVKQVRKQQALSFPKMKPECPYVDPRSLRIKSPTRSFNLYIVYFYPKMWR